MIHSHYGSQLVTEKKLFYNNSDISLNLEKVK